MLSLLVVMRPVLAKIKPTSGFSYILHILIVLIIPAAIYILVTLNFYQLALSIIVLSKWRMFAVKPRFWAANIRANAVDLMVGLSVVAFMAETHLAIYRLAWAIAYAIWLLYIKPSTNLIVISLQAFIGQFLGLTALYLAWTSGPIYGLTLSTGVICYLAARHYLDAYDEVYSKLISFAWGYFGAALAWVLSHWLLFYDKYITLTTIILSCIGYGLAALYYLDHYDKLNKSLKRQIVLLLGIVIVGVIIISKWRVSAV